MSLNGKQFLQLLRPRKGLLTFIIFLILSGLFWLSTALNGYYDYEVDLPVEYINMPANIIPIVEGNGVVHVTVHDKGFALLQYAQKDKKLPLKIQFSAFSHASSKFLVPTSELHKLVARRFPNSTIINSIKPDKIEYNYIEGVGKTVPVRLEGDFLPAINYYLEHVEIEPTKVTIYADENEINNIQYVETEKMQVKNFSDIVRSRVNIKTKPNTKVVPNDVSVALFPDVLTEEIAEVPVTMINVPDGITIKLFPQMVNVRFTVGASTYRNIDVSQFKVQLDYDNISQNTEKCVISIVQIPQGVKQANLIKGEVGYLIEK